MIRILTGMLLLLALLQAGFAQGQPQDSGLCRAWISADRDSSGTRFAAMFRNNGSQKITVHYDMKMLKEGRSGTSHSSQSGAAEVGPGESCLLSRVRMNVARSDRYSVQLQVYHDKTLIAGDLLAYPDPQHQKK